MSEEKIRELIAEVQAARAYLYGDGSGDEEIRDRLFLIEKKLGAMLPRIGGKVNIDLQSAQVN